MVRAVIAPSAAPSGPAVEWDDTPCPLCGRRDEEYVLEAPDPCPAHSSDGPAPALRFAVVRCKSCGLTYTNPRPDPGCIGRFYPADYRPHRRPRKMREARGEKREEAGRGLAARVSLFAARLSGRGSPERDGGLPWVGQGRLLDFGCGGGGYLKRMADQGWQVTGLDAAVGAVRQAAELGVRAVAGTLPHPDLLPGSFDVVTMWHSLEHVHRPLAILREAFRLLVPGGKLVVACPNRDSWAARAFGPHWFGLDLPRHLTHFTPDTLTAMLTAGGFRAGPVRLVRHSDWLRSSGKLAVRGGSASAWQAALTWKPLAKLAAWAAYAGGSSDCMMAVAERPG